MRVLVACEFSGVVRNAFSDCGDFAMSCDLLPTERPGTHHAGDVTAVLDQSWDLMIAHPECKYLANSGIRWLYKGGRKVNGKDAARWTAMRKGAAFVRTLWGSPPKRICIEQPRDHVYANDLIGVPVTQSIQPWNFGHWETKETCLRLKNLPPLRLTYKSIDECREALGLEPGSMPRPRVHHASPGPDRWKERSRTLPYIAEAFTQWSE